MSNAYRSAYQQIVGTRLAEMRLVHQQLEPLVPQLRSVRAARIARAMAGGVGIAGAVAMVGAACFDETTATYTLLGSSLGMLATYVLARVILAIVSMARMARPSASRLRLTGQLETDLARIGASDPRESIARRLTRLEMWSLALPLAALSLLLPLTLHYAFGSLVISDSAKGFGGWIRISLVIVGHAHLTLMALAIAFARRLSRADHDELATMSVHKEWGKALAITVAVSSVPGLVLMALPPLLTTITGLAFIPFMFILARRCILHERATMALASAGGGFYVAPQEAPLVEELQPWIEVSSAQCSL